MSKPLTIIETKKESEYSTLLLQLISVKDDDSETGEIRGIKDGSVNAALWTEKEYQDSKSKIASNHKFLFVGLSDTSKAIAKNIVFNREWAQYGIYIGWLGNIGVLYADPNIMLKDKEKYEEFYAVYSDAFSAVENTTAAQNTTDKAESATEKITNTLNKGLYGASKGAHKVVNFGKQVKGLIKKEKVKVNEFDGEKAPQISEKATKALVGGAIAFPIAILDKALVAMVVSKVTKAKNKKEIKDQIYRYTILEFYSKYLSKFMELDD